MLDNTTVLMNPADPIDFRDKEKIFGDLVSKSMKNIFWACAHSDEQPVTSQFLRNQLDALYKQLVTYHQREQGSEEEARKWGSQKYI